MNIDRDQGMSFLHAINVILLVTPQWDCSPKRPRHKPIERRFLGTHQAPIKKKHHRVFFTASLILAYLVSPSHRKGKF